MTVVFVLYFLLAIVLMVKLLLNGVRPTKTLAWLLAVFTIPIGGMLFYFILGRNKKKNKFYKLIETKDIKHYLEKVEDYYNRIDSKEEEIPAQLKDHIKLVKLITKSAKFLPSSGNELTPLKDGQVTFDAIFKAMESASQFIHIQYYIFEDGELAQRFLTILKQKVNEGVEVRFMYDDLGSRLLSNKYLKLLKDAGIEVFGFLPMRFGRLISSLNYRNHRKVVIVDGLVAFTGGINVSDKYIKGDANLGVWHDMHLQLKGPIVNSLQSVFAVD
ncbi:phospholipase D-like domain-containing protein [Aquimarina sp. I32.4]|uniref:phospholipase D-like domain-containing protein n=1 Tax=Aquimarina sp. I32.4 TaxID=2053903 RepID=UPI000CDE8CD2|nr:phospholipase D-like domain-containing protein [Aquimarina sp. I32.4]